MGYVGDPNCKASYIVDLNKLPPHLKEAINEHGFNEMKDTIPAQDLLEASTARTLIKIAKDEENNPIILLEPSYGNKAMDTYFNLFIDLMLAEPMQTKMARGGGNEHITTGNSISPAGQYEDTVLSSVHFITKHTEQTEEEQATAERIRQSR